MENILDVNDIVKNFLEENGYGGLCAVECGCELGELFPCDDDEQNISGHGVSECRPGYKVYCNESCGHPVPGWHIQAVKPEAPND